MSVEREWWQEDPWAMPEMPLERCALAPQKIWREVERACMIGWPFKCRTAIRLYASELRKSSGRPPMTAKEMAEYEQTAVTVSWLHYDLLKVLAACSVPVLSLFTAFTLRERVGR